MTVTQLLVQVLLPIAGTVLCSLLGRWLQVSSSSIASRSKQDAVTWATAQILAKAGAIVMKIEQTERGRWAQAAKDGKLTPDEAQNLAKQALLDLYSIAREEFGALLSSGFDQGRIETLAKIAIESAVRKMKGSTT
jgi:hypothetical protein